MRDVTQLHPALQEKITELQAACRKQGITIKIGECLRTTAEQDALYAKGRTTAGSIVTNAKGSTYSSMHQWGVAFDFYLAMDVDGDGKTSDDAFNNATKLFNKVGKIGQEIGLEWGGSWKSITDLPHFQLPNWGSTATKLKATYGTPEKFFATWSKASSSVTSKVETTSTKTTTKSTKSGIETAVSYSKSYVKWYTTTANLNLRTGAGTNKDIVTTIPKGKSVQCYGYYNESGGTKWLCVAYGKYTGYVSKKYLK